VQRIEDFIAYASSGSVAALIIEPVSGVGGNVIPPPGYLQELKAFCEAREIVLIFDEIQTAFGRTGQMFAADHFGVSPHMMTVSKGLTGSGLPLAAILTEERMADWDRSLHGFTYGGHTLSAAAAVKTLDIVQRPGFLENVRECGAILADRLRALRSDHPVVGDVRGLGLMLGVELVEPDGGKAVRRTHEFQRALHRHGVLTRVSEHGLGNVIELRPPLVITPAEANVIADRFGEALDDIS
jgi:4-aminobutyrate aminotransferase-like enzyme